MDTVIRSVLIATMDKDCNSFMGDIVMEDGRIKALNPCGPYVKRRDDGALPERCLVLPGFVDGHLHAQFLAWRYDGYGNMNALKESASRDEQLAVTRYARAEAARAGVTFLCDFAYYDAGCLKSTRTQLGADAVIADLIARPMGGCVRVRLPEENDGELKVPAAIKHLTDVLNLVKTLPSGTPPICLFVHPPVEREPAYRPAVMETYHEVLTPFHDEPLLWIHGHCGEYLDSLGFAAQWFDGMTPVQVLDRYGLLRGRTVLAHCIWTGSEDLKLIQQRGARVLSTPKFSLRTGKNRFSGNTSGYPSSAQIAPIGDMLDMGIRVGLCSDAYAIDPLNRATQAWHLHRSFQGRSRPLEELEALSLITSKAAAVYGLEDQIGSIETGKRADLVLFDLSGQDFDPFWSPTFWQLAHSMNPEARADWREPMEGLVHCSALSKGNIHSVLVGGETVYRRR